jgi:sulfide:quinone oxidoreductase
VTPEQTPLEVFGDEIAATTAMLLADRGVRVVCGTLPRTVDRTGLHLAWGGTVPADRVIAIPSLVGQRIAGVPSNFSGFVQTDGNGRILDVEGVWAAGDMTSWPVKQGGLAAQQAERAAADIARLAGADVPFSPPRPVLRARLAGAGAPLFLRAELGPDGHPLAGTASMADEPTWWPGAKVFGRHLTPWMAMHAPVRETVAA